MSPQGLPFDANATPLPMEMMKEAVLVPVSSGLYNVTIGNGILASKTANGDAVRYVIRITPQDVTGAMNRVEAK